MKPLKAMKTFPLFLYIFTSTVLPFIWQTAGHSVVIFADSSRKCRMSRSIKSGGMKNHDDPKVKEPPTKSQRNHSF